MFSGTSSRQSTAVNTLKGMFAGFLSLIIASVIGVFTGVGCILTLEEVFLVNDWVTFGIMLILVGIVLWAVVWKMMDWLTRLLRVDPR